MRLFASNEVIFSNRIVIRGDDLFHLKDVLRIKPNDEVIVCDNNCLDYICKVENITKQEARLFIVDQQQNKNELPVNVTLYQGLPKSPKIQTIIQKSVELGAYEIIFMSTSRCVPRVKGDSLNNKQDRYQKIAKAAAMQSQRGIIPKVRFCTFLDAIENSTQFDINLMPYELEKNASLKQSLKLDFKRLNSIAAYIGPEGGFSPEEVDMAIDHKIKPITLGPRILKTETATIVTLALIMNEIENDIF